MRNEFLNSDGDNFITTALKKEQKTEEDESYIPLVSAFVFHAVGVFIGVKRKAGLLELIALSAGFGLVGAGIGKGISKIFIKN